MKPDSDAKSELLQAQQIANALVTARLAASARDDFPGAIPANLAAAYQIQDLAIDQWPEAVGGWKVGRIPPALEESFGIDRLAGPVFSNTIEFENSGTLLEMPVFAGGFAAIEAEFVAIIASDAPQEKTDWSLAETVDMISDLRIGLEIASSPLATINELGPPVVVADFGNNAGLIIGPSIQNWRSRDLQTMQSETFVDDESVGQGGAFTLTGGFIRSVQFLLEQTSARGRPVRSGDCIATGQTTGIHNVLPGQNTRIDFGSDGVINCRITAAVSAS